MRPIRITRLGPVVALLVSTVIVVASPAAAEPPDGWDPAAVALADDLGIPIAEAEARIGRQEAAEALADRARVAFGSRFGGAYVDQERGGALVAGFVGAVPSGELAQLASQFGLQGFVIGETVRYSQDQLERALDSLADGLAEANKGARVPLGAALRFDLNAVELSQPATVPATDAQRRFIADASAQFGNMLVHVRSDDVPQLAAAECNFPGCDSPLRGGVTLLNCTTGFMTQSKVDSKKYVLTAGHCVSGNPNAVRKTELADGTDVAIGKTHNYTFGAGGDMAIIRIDSPGYWNPAPWVYVTQSNGGYPTTTNAKYTISGVGTSSGLIGKYLCKTGMTTGTSCGKVEAIGVTVSYPSAVVKNLGRAKMHLCKGDSGGPLYVKHVAYGLVSGMMTYPGSTTCGGTIFYQGVKGAANAMNVNLLTA